MGNRYIPKYHDDSDYNTNAPSYYEDLARKAKLIELLSKKIWEYENTLNESLEQIEKRLTDYITENDSLMNERLENWDKKIEEMPEEMRSLFVEWLNDGTLEQIINHDVLGNKADQSELDKTNTQLEQTTKHGDVFLNAKSYGSLGDGVQDDTEYLQQMLIDAYRNKRSIVIPKGEYLISKPLIVITDNNELNSSISIEGENLENTVIECSVNFDAHLETGVLSNKAAIIVVNESYLNPDNTFKEGTQGRTGGVFIDKLYLISPHKNVDYGILFGNMNAGSSYSRLRIRNFAKSGIKNLDHFYLNTLMQVRVDGTPISFDLGEHINTSLKLDSCYSVGASDTGFKIRGTYMTMINPAVDGCSGTAYDLLAYRGTVISPGAESQNALEMFKVGQYSAVTVTTPYTIGNFDDASAWHVVNDGAGSITFKGGELLYDHTGQDRVALGGLVKHGTQSIVSFEDVNIGKYTKNSDYKDTTISKEYKTKHGRINTRGGDDLSYIGFDGGSGFGDTLSAKEGWVDVESENKKVLGNGLFFGMGEDIGWTDDDKDIRWQKGFVKGDIILTRSPEVIGGIGWVVTNNTNDVSSVATNSLKIPVIMSGTTEERPTQRVVGQQYFDTTLEKPIWWKGAGKWVDAMGTVV